MSTPTSGKIVVLSDIHIGDGTPTVWYQPAVHDPYLGAICDWIVANSSTVAEVVLLGDIVDFWTQPAAKQPPTFAEIVSANPQIFGPAGFFGRVLDAVGGRVTYVPGNHDMGVTAADVSTIVSAGGHRMQFAPEIYFPLGADQSIALAHGNEFTMFNAPDPHSQWGTLPVGHFVTRMVASAWAAKLQPGETVADLPDQGSPDGLDYWSILWGCFSRADISVAGALLDSVAEQTGTPPDQQFLMPDGSTTTLSAVHALYDDLFTRWRDDQGGGAIGDLVTWKSVLADARAYYMGWFAQRAAFEAGSDVIVFGHTHEPQLGLDTTMVGYANSGFGCPSKPDMPTKPITFAVVDVATKTAHVMQCVSSGGDAPAVSEFAATPTSVVPIGMDDSCYVKICNTTGSDLVLSSSSVVHGYWAAPPPERIVAGGLGLLWLQDLPSANGSAGSVTYTSPEGTHPFTFACPSLLFQRNQCSGGTSFRTKSGSDPWGAPGSVATAGHPFYVEFTV